MSDQARFLLNVDRKGDDECWDWRGGRDPVSGRGKFWMRGKTWTAPRAAWVLFRGEISDETLEVLHSCDRPICCNLKHLRLGTKTENMQDMAKKGRAGIQRHPERYAGCRSRRPDVKYRPVKQSMAPKPIDHRTWTRLATTAERQLARRAVEDLERQHNRIGFVPADDGTHKKLRVQTESNPDWYREFGKAYWRESSFLLKRSRVEKALRRVAEKGRVRGNGYERILLSFLGEQSGIAHVCEKSAEDGVRAMMKVGDEWTEDPDPYGHDSV